MTTSLDQDIDALKEKLSKLAKLSTLLNQAGETAQNAAATAASVTESYQITVKKLEAHVQKQLTLSEHAEQEQQELLREFNEKVEQVAKRIDVQINRSTALNEEVGEAIIKTLKSQTEKVLDRYHSVLLETTADLDQKAEDVETRFNTNRKQLQQELNQSVEKLKAAHDNYIAQIAGDFRNLSTDMQGVLSKQTELVRVEMGKLNHSNRNDFDKLVSGNDKTLSNLSSELTGRFDKQSEALSNFTKSTLTTLQKNSELVNPFSERINTLLERVSKIQTAHSLLNDYLREMHMAVNERFSALSSEMRDQLQEFQSSTRNQIETLISQQEANEKKHDEQFHFVQKFLYRTLTGIVIVAGLVIYKLFFR